MMSSTPKSEDPCCWKLLCIVGLLYDFSWKQNTIPLQMDGLLPLEGMYFWMISFIQMFVNFWHFMQQLLSSFLKRLWLMLVHFLAIGRGYTTLSHKHAVNLVEHWCKKDERIALVGELVGFLFLTPKCVNCLLSWGFEHVGKFGYMRLYHNPPSKCLLLLSPSNHLLHGCQLLSCYTYIDIWCCLTLQVYIR